MIKINPESINDLLELHSKGVPVTMTSHPGNASLYKLSLWTCGIPEHLWDITCCVADRNNQPLVILRDGKAQRLLTEEKHQRILRETSSSHRFVTAYQEIIPGRRIGRVHVRAMQECFPGVISSQSRTLLAAWDKLEEVFLYLAETCPGKVFARQISAQGVMTPFDPSGRRPRDLVDSFHRVLRELDHLIHHDEPIETEGGVCYEGVMVPLSLMLVQGWQSNYANRHDISGPDMIGYATRPGYAGMVGMMLEQLRKAKLSSYIPECFMVQMHPGTYARVGHLDGHFSKAAIRRKLKVLQWEGQLSKEDRRAFAQDARDDEQKWPVDIRPDIDCYFSQHDLLAHGGKIEVADYWRTLPIRLLRERLKQANGLLGLK